jgi:hypothetical protein
VGTNGLATYSDTALSEGTHSLMAAYSGNAAFLPSSSAAVPFVITIGSISVGFSGSQNDAVVPGSPATYNLMFSPVLTGTFLYPVQLTATGLPPGATYTFSPALIPAGSGSLPVIFTVQTAKGTASLGTPGTSFRLGSRGLAALAFGLLLPLAGARRFRARVTKLPRILLLLLFGTLSLGMVAGLGGCGSGGFLATPAGQTHYTITIVATSGTLVRTVTVQLNLE